MSILDKFAAVEIKADHRITEEDKAFCQKQQEAFDKSGEALRKLKEMAESARAEQEAILGETSFMGGVSGGSDFDDAMKKRNETFIERVVHYFEKQYKVDLDKREICKHLIPAEPECPPYRGYYRNMTDEELDAHEKEMEAYKAEKDAHEQAILNLPLRYEQVVDEIFVQLGGFSFAERSMNEFLSRTWKCCHNTYRDDIEEFEIKNDTLKLTGYWCSTSAWNPDEFKPAECLKTLLNAVAWYECGRMGEGHLWFPELFKYDTKQNFFEIYNMEKVKSVRLYKNGRVDIKFRNAAYVQEFVETCLRRKAA